QVEYSILDRNVTGFKMCTLPIYTKELDSKDQEQTIILPFNDLEHAEEILKANQDQIAALVMEPIQDGFLPVDQSFINGIRQITQKLGIVLIFDEVKTGFRVSMGVA